jgi:hypothetical protein
MKRLSMERPRTIVGVVSAALLLAVIWACSGGGGAVGHDAGSEGSDANAANDANEVRSEAAASDGSGPGDAQLQSEASTLAPSTGTLSGALAFSIGKVITATATHSPFSSGGDCGGTTAAMPGVIPAVAIFFAETGFAAQNICNPAVGYPDAGTNTILDLEVATAQWATYPGTLTEPLVPGTYMISNEQDNEETLCKLRGGGTAYLQIYPWGAPSSAIAVSGTVTINSIAAGSVTGRFDVLMGGPFGQTDAAAPTPLSGEFNAIPCP